DGQQAVQAGRGLQNARAPAVALWIRSTQRALWATGTNTDKCGRGEQEVGTPRRTYAGNWRRRRLLPAEQRSRLYPPSLRPDLEGIRGHRAGRRSRCRILLADEGLATLRKVDELSRTL